MSGDIDDLLDNDKERVQNAVSNTRGGSTLPGPARAIEGVLWTLSILALGFMLVALFFTGEDGFLSGELWLAMSLLALIAPAVLAGLVRWLRLGGARAIDNIIGSKLE